MERKGRVEEDHEDDASKRAKLSFEEEEEEAPLAILEKVEDGCRECFKENWSNYIRTCHQVKEKTVDIYNYRLQNKGAELEEVLRHVFRQKRNAFKVNLAFGFISKNVETGEVRYFYPSQNGFVFDALFLITNDADLDAFLEKLKEDDWLEYLRQQKPNSKWSIAMFTNAANACQSIEDISSPKWKASRWIEFFPPQKKSTLYQSIEEIHSTLFKANLWTRY